MTRFVIERNLQGLSDQARLSDIPCDHVSEVRELRPESYERH